MPRVQATPTPSVLIWARKSAGMSIEVAAHKAAVKPEQLAAWEEGTARPSIPQLRKIASVYRRPLAAFYLAEPPQRFEVMHDFRRLTPHLIPAESSPRLAFEIRRAYDRREWALELMADMDESPPVFDLTASVADNVEQVAGRLRGALGVTLRDQEGWSVEGDAFRNWRQLLERAGLMTLQATDLQLNEARGFSINLRPLPVVVTNIKDAPRARIFTLLHETVHVMVNEGGSICDLHDADAEAYCNRVAGAVLFPREAILASNVFRRHKKGDPVWTDPELRDLSRQFGGSREAALVRLLTLRLTTQSYFERMHKKFIAEYQQMEKKRQESAGFAPPYVVAISSAGPLFTNLVVEGLNRDKITASDVSDYLQIRLKHLKDLRSEASKGVQV